MAENYLGAASEEMLSSLLILSELKIGASAGASTKVPLVSGSFQGVSELLNQAIQYLEFSNLIIGMQLLLLALSQSALLKILIIPALAILFIYEKRKLVIEILMVLLMINPGLTIYVLGIKYIAQEVEINLGSDLNQELKTAHASYLEKRKDQESQMDKRKSTQLQKAEAKGKDKISLLNKVEDAVIGTTEKIGDDLSLIFSDTLEILKSAGEKMINMCLNLFTHILLVFFLLPMVYYYLMRRVLKEFFSININPNPTKT